MTWRQARSRLACWWVLVVCWQGCMYATGERADGVACIREARAANLVREMGDGEGDDGDGEEMMGDGEGDGRMMTLSRVACTRPRSAHRVTARQVHRPRELAECEAASIRRFSSTSSGPALGRRHRLRLKLKLGWVQAQARAGSCGRVWSDHRAGVSLEGGRRAASANGGAATWCRARVER